MSLFKNILLMTLLIGEGLPSYADDSPEPPKMSLEIREAESMPGAELTEASVRGAHDKVYLAKEAALTVDDISRVRGTMDVAGRPALEVSFTEEGARKMLALTERRIEKQVAFLVNGEVVGAPVVRSRISSQCEITGSFTKPEIEALVRSINGPPSPFPNWIVWVGLLTLSLLIGLVCWTSRSKNKRHIADATD
ncbi:MAG: hypothetical protein H7062_16700 [Candidatus Saccharimonas sp.]|nr:hypothetical protein [Planctomycetaceae bacterium]